MKLETTATCDCNLARETVEHYLLECPIHQNSRDDLDRRVQEIWNNSYAHGNLSITKELLLSATGTAKISREMNILIKRALFEFIESSGKLL